MGEGDEDFSLEIYADKDFKELLFKTDTITIKDTSTSLGSWYDSGINGKLWSQKFPWRQPSQNLVTLNSLQVTDLKTIQF